MRKGDEPTALLFRQLAEAKKQEKLNDAQDRDEREVALDKLWNKSRAEYGPKVVSPGRMELVRRAKVVAERGELTLNVDLGVNEDRLRISSSIKEFAFAEAALAEKAVLQPHWAYLERLGWLLQTRDGKYLSEHGEELKRALLSMGFHVRFTPHYIKDHFANPYFNALLDLDW